MKRTGMLVVLCVFLTACGGGSSDSTPEPTPTPTPPVQTNTAPTLTGQLTLTVPANVTGTLVLDVNDAEGDTITASYESLDWLTLSISEGQLTVDATPTVFELGENAVEIVLTDGTDSNTYMLNVNVQDNPSSYSYVTINESTLQGSWQLSDGRELFIGAVRGFFVDSSVDVTPFTWLIFDGDLELQAHPFGCNECPTQAVIELYVIEEDQNGRFAIRLEGDQVNAQTLIATPNLNNSFNASTYAALTKAGGDVFRADSSQSQVTLSFDLRLPIQNSVLFTSQRYNAEALTSGDGNLSLFLPSPSPSNTTFFGNFDVINFGGSVRVELGTQLSDLVVSTTSNGLVVLTGIVQFRIADEASLAFPISDYVGLQDTLDTQLNAITVYAELQPVDFPSFSEGDVYMLNTRHQSDITGETASFGKLNITGAQTANIEMEVLDPINPGIEIHDATYTIDGNSLSLVIDDRTYDFSLFTNNFQQRVSVSDYSFEGQPRTLNYPFFKMEAVNLESADLLGFWETETFVSPFSRGPELMWFSNEQQMDRSFEYDRRPADDDFYRLLDDNTFSILRGFQCRNAISYDECVQEVLDAAISGAFITIYNEKMEVFSISKDNLFATRTVWIQQGSSEADVLIGTFSRIFKRADTDRID